MSLKHFAIYNTATHEAEDPGSVGPIDTDAMEDVCNLVDDMDPETGVVKGKKEKKVVEINLSAQREKALYLECAGRGTLNGEWKVYAKPEPFDWANLVNGYVMSATEKADYDKAVKESAEKAASGG
jgi:hypothetical protein